MEKKEQRIQDNIIFLGDRKDVYRLYQAMDVFVLPSRYEGLPVVGVEAQANGLPCLLSDKMTKETKMTSNVEFLSVRHGVEKWVKKIKYNMVSKRAYKHLDKYDIAIQANELESYYIYLFK